MYYRFLPQKSRSHQKQTSQPKTINKSSNKRLVKSKSMYFLQEDNEELLSTTHKRISFKKNEDDFRIKPLANEDDPIEIEFNIDYPTTNKNKLESKDDLEYGHSYDEELLVTHYEDSITSPNNIYRRKQTRTLKVDNIPVLTPERKKRPKSTGNDSELIDPCSFHDDKLLKQPRQHLLLLCRLLMKKYNIDDIWLDVMIKFTDQIVQNVSPNYRQGDKMDILHYTKIVCVPGGSINECEYVDGIVFKKNRMHKKMADNLYGPKVMIIRNSIGSFNDKDGLVSFDGLLQNDNKYLNSSISMISAARPQLLFVEKNVCHEARDMLYKKGITVLCNIKPEIINILSRITNAGIIQLIQNSVNATIGLCGRYKVVSYSGPWGKKTLTFISGCPIDKFGTVVIRGAPEPVLKKVKTILKYLIYTAYNMKLETSLLLEQHATVKDDNIKIENIENIDDLQVLYSSSWSVKIDKHSIIKTKFNENENDKLLQVTPELKGPPLGCELYIGVEKFKNGSYQPISNRKNVTSITYKSILKENIEPNLDPEPPVIMRRKYEDKPSKARLFTDYLRKNRLREPNILSPQYLLYLHSLFCTSTATQCRPYEYYMTNYYSINDIPLGIFLEDFCFSKDLRCQNAECYRPIIEHERTFLHNGGRLNIIVKTIDTMVDIALPLGLNSSIYSLFTCKDNRNCSSHTPYMTLLSKETWNLSFGKFLEHVFYDNCICRYCKNSLYKNHHIYFYYKNMVAYFAYESMNILHVQPPSMKIELNLKTDHMYILRQEIESLVSITKKFYERVANKLNEILELGTISDQQEIEHIHKLIKNSEEEMASLLELVCMEEELIALAETNIFRINSLRRSLYISMASWNNIINEYELRAMKSKSVIKGSSIIGDYTKNKNKSSNLYNSSEIPRSPTPELASSQSDDSEHFVPSNLTMVSVSSDSELVNPHLDPPKDVEEPFNKETMAFKVLAAIEVVLPQKRQTVLDVLEEEKAYIFPQENTNEPVVVVYEFNPASIITFALTSDKYFKKMQQFPFSPLKDYAQEEEVCGLVLDDNTTIDLEWKQSPIWGGSKIVLHCKTYFARQFAWLRKLIGISEETFAQSLQKCKSWKARGGKSSSRFGKTLDGRFVIKQVQHIELEAFLHSAPLYFDYMSKVIFHQVPTTLTKILGIYSVTFSKRGRSPIKVDLIIMENLFYNEKITKIYDLKGSLRSRYAKPNSPDDKDIVYLDENFLESLFEHPICVSNESKSKLGITIWNDTLCLSKLDVMDYSLLVGVDEENGKLVLGIIDYMRTYTWDKQLETWVKRTGILGGNTKTNVPTIISPKQYKKRFRLAMWNYFQLLPYIGMNIVYMDENVN